MPYDLTAYSPPPAALSARPYEIEDLDRLNDPRLWATILATANHIQEDADNRIGEHDDELEKDAREEGEQNILDELACLSLTLETDNMGQLVIGHNLNLTDAVGILLTEKLAAFSDLLRLKLDSLADDLAAITKTRADGKAGLAELQDMVREAVERKDMPWSVRRDLEQGRYDAGTLSRALTKPDLADIAVIAMNRLYRAFKA